jgi:hypothetical protein
MVLVINAKLGKSLVLGDARVPRLRHRQPLTGAELVLSRLSSVALAAGQQSLVRLFFSLTFLKDF